MRARLMCFAIALIALASCGVSHADEQVGEFADPTQLEFIGNAQFSDNELREGLFKDADVLVAAHEFAPLDKFIELLPRRIEAGYQCARFFDVQACAVLNRCTGRIEISIDEGTRSQFDAVSAEAILRTITPSSPVFGTLAMKVLEYAATPTLIESLPAESQAILNFGRWLISIGERGDELVLRSTYGAGVSAELVLTADRGIIVHATAPDPAGGKPLQYAALVTDETISLYALSRVEKLEVEPNFHVFSSLANIDGMPFMMRLGAGTLTPRHGPMSERMQILQRITLAIFAALTNPQSLHTVLPCELKDGVLTVDYHSLQLKIRAETGELLSLDFAQAGCPSATVTVERGAFATRLATLQPEVANCRNVFDAQRPFASIADFILDDHAWRYVAHDPETVIALGIIRKFFAAEVLDAMLPWFETLSDNTDGFIVERPKLMDSLTSGEGGSPWLDVLRSQMPALAAQAFPNDSWAYDLTIEFALASCGRGEYFSQAFEYGLSQSEWGPLACWCFATGASAASHQECCEPCARAALSLLASSDFDRDCRALIDPDTVMGQVACRMATFVRSLNVFEMLAFEAATRRVSHAIGPAMRSLRADRDKPIETALPKALSIGWQEGWRDAMSTHLSDMLSGAGAATAASPDATKQAR